MITAGTSNSTVNIAVINDNIVEGNETFNMTMSVPSSLGPGITTGSITSATATIIDTSSKLHHYYIIIRSCLCILLLLQESQ